MNETVLFSLSAILIIGFPILAYFFYSKVFLSRSLTKNNGDYVVLLHGFARTSASMQKLGQRLVRAGYKVLDLDYPPKLDLSGKDNTIENISDRYLKVKLKQKCVDKTKKINFVTHSMGGIIVRYFLANNKLKNLNRVILISPPNHGSEVADKWILNKAVNRAIGPVLAELCTDKKSFVNRLPSPNYEVGIIFGEYDRTVSRKSVQLKNVKDFLTVARGHSFLMYADEVIDATLDFLRRGRFKQKELS